MQLQALAKHPPIIDSWLSAPRFELNYLECDSRRVRPGAGFFALGGFREDGHRYVESALAAGAEVVFVSDAEVFGRLARERPGGLAGVFLVPQGRVALADAAALVYCSPSRRLHLLGVTGTNGKTTVTHLAAQISRQLGTPCGVVGSLGMTIGDEMRESERTTPEAPVIEAFLRDCLDQGVGRVAAEVTSIGIELERTRNLAFRSAAFTNLTQDHLDFHGSMSAYAAAKARLFLESAVEQVVINLDCPAGVELVGRIQAERSALPLLTYGMAEGAELRAEGARFDGQGCRGLLCHGSRREPFHAPLLGRFNLSNLLAAVGLLLACDEELGELAAALVHCRSVPGRFERVALGGGITAVVDYSHTPDSLENALLTARQLTVGRVLAVFGCGGERDVAKRPMMGEVAARLSDWAVVTSDNPRGEDPEQIIDAVVGDLKGSAGAMERIVDRRQAIYRALDQAKSGDIVLVAGKGNEPYQEIAGKKLPLDDREIVRDWAKDRNMDRGVRPDNG